MSDAGMQGADGGGRRRRTWSADQKQRIIAESFAPGASVAEVARRYGLNSNMLFTWRRRERADVSDVGETVNIVPVITAADLLNDRVVRFYDAHEVKLCRVLTDRGTEYCGNPEHHEYELYLALEDIDHSRTKTKSPQTNGIVERFHKTVLDEFYRVAFRKKIYGSIAELQSDLDDWVRSYNEERAHQGRWCFGKTPMQTFLDATPLAKEKMIAA